MNHQQNKITCPNCGFEIDVNDVLYHQVDEELKRKYDQAFSKEKARLESRESEIEKIKSDLEKERRKQQELITRQVESQIAEERLRLKKELQKSIEQEHSERQKLLEDELNTKSEQLKEYHKARSEIERLKREKSELKASIEAESERKLNEMLEAEKAKIHKQEEQKSRLRLSEKEKIIEQLSQQLKEAQRKAEQGSTQLQGEVQELAIEDWLSEHFPLDTIEEIRKGARGADCIQIVNTRTRQNCGTIYYESKRTKGFQPGWIEKFRQDIRERSADIGVLVTESMPADMDRLGLKDGIWICSFDEFKGLCHVLRESLINLSRALSTQENKGDKMNMLYDYLTGNEFKLQVEAIVEGFSQMQSDLESEKRSMAGIWKKREKQIQKVLLNTTHMYGSIKGIAGSAIKSVPLLEIEEDEGGENNQ